MASEIINQAEVRSEPIEAPSGKQAKDENFPVGSLLISKELRPHVAIYYAFARAGDDIGDDPTLSPDEKVRRLTAFESALLNPENAPLGSQKAVRLNESLKMRGVSLERGRKLLDAFRQDAVKNRYANWDELIDYCTKSADPVGRYLLDLHDEDPTAYKNSDALCTVLQILNHMQDCGEDKAEINRVYIPADYLADVGLDDGVLDLKKSPTEFISVLNRMLDECEPLLLLCKELPANLKNRHLAAESTVIVDLAHRLANHLRKGDPLKNRIKLTKIDFILAGLKGLYCFATHRVGR